MMPVEQFNVGGPTPVRSALHGCCVGAPIIEVAAHKHFRRVRRVAVESDRVPGTARRIIRRSRLAGG